MFKRAERRTRLCRAIGALSLASMSLVTGVMTGCAKSPLQTRKHMPGASRVSSADTVNSFPQLMDNAMAVMNHDMASAPMTGDPDRDFAVMMIPHHEAAIDMAKAELLYGKDPVLRRLAQEIVVTQASEVTVMQAELKKVRAGSTTLR